MCDNHCKNTHEAPITFISHFFHAHHISGVSPPQCVNLTFYQEYLLCTLFLTPSEIKSLWNNTFLRGIISDGLRTRCIKQPRRTKKDDNINSTHSRTPSHENPSKPIKSLRMGQLPDDFLAHISLGYGPMENHLRPLGTDKSSDFLSDFLFSFICNPTRSNYSASNILLTYIYRLPYLSVFL